MQQANYVLAGASLIAVSIMVNNFFPPNILRTDQESDDMHGYTCFPAVTIAIPMLNEESNIEKVITSFLGTKYPRLVEVLAADGGSTDRTAEIVRQLSQKDSRVKLLHNPERIQAAGLNLMLHRAVGDIFMRADAHSEYADDYVEQCVKALRLTGARNVGGAVRIVAANSVQLGVALAVRTPMGNGRARHFDPDYEGPAETVSFGCFWKEDLIGIGGYPPTAVTGEDADVNLRLAGPHAIWSLGYRPDGFGACPQGKRVGPVVVSRNIRFWYYPRGSFTSLGKQYFKYGRGRCIACETHGVKSSARGVTPFACLLSVLGFLVLSAVYVSCLFALLAVSCLFGALCLVAVIYCVKNRHKVPNEIWRGSPDRVPILYAQIANCILALTTMLALQPLGFGYQLFRRIVLRHKGW